VEVTSPVQRHLASLSEAQQVVSVPFSARRQVLGLCSAVVQLVLLCTIGPKEI
jgi:hypothetical protein